METSTRLGPYRLDELTGEGSVAQVYKAWHRELHRFEALKLLRDSMTHEATIVARFLSEARTAAKLQHPHIATIYSVGDDGSRPYFTMEMVEGRDLGEHLLRRGPLTLDEAAPLLQQIAEAIDYAHRVGVIHRDIKPANILLGDSLGGGYTVKLVDFGIARVQAEEAASRLTQTGGIVGTPKYISPEQASEQPVDYRADIYSFGVVAYEMLCGRTPFESPECATTMALLMAHVHSIPPAPKNLAPALAQTTSDALLRSLAKSPEDRFHTCGEFVRVLTAPCITEAPSTGPIAADPQAAPINAAAMPQTAWSAPTERQTVPKAAEPPTAPPGLLLKRTLGAATGAVLGVLAVVAGFALTRPTPPPAPIGGKPATAHINGKAASAPHKAALSTMPAAHTPAATAPQTIHVSIASAAPIAHPAVLKTAPSAPAASPPTPHPAPNPSTAAHPAPLPSTTVAPPHTMSPIASAPKPAVKSLPHTAATHAPSRKRHGHVRPSRKPKSTQTRGQLNANRNLAAAWEASYHQEMALARSYRSKGDLVQANALAQNAADSRSHAQNASKTKKRKTRR